MRTKSSPQGHLDFTPPSRSKIVETYRRKYGAISEVLDGSPKLLTQLMKDAGPELGRLGMRHRFHVRKVKKLAYYVSRKAAKSRKREQRRIFEDVHKPVKARTT